MSDQATATPTATGKGACPANTPHGEAWGALARTHAAVSQRLQEALAQGDYPPLPWYEVLAAVAEAPEQRMRMGDLAEALVITRGGLTKLVDRLVKAGLLERTFCDPDRRAAAYRKNAAPRHAHSFLARQRDRSTIAVTTEGIRQERLPSHHEWVLAGIISLAAVKGGMPSPVPKV